MYQVKVEGNFSSAHSLRGYKGKCEALHGHNWKVEVEARSDDLDAVGMVVDFKVMKQKLHAALETLDHTHLNRIPYFKKINPTSEHIAKYLFVKLEKSIPLLFAVRVWESENSSATYSK